MAIESDANSAYKKNLEDLIEATREGRIPWQRQNPSTYFFERVIDKETKFVTSIQVLSMVAGHVFQIINAKTKDVIIDISTGNGVFSSAFVSGFSAILNPRNTLTDKEMFGNLLSTLYHEVDQSVGMKSANIFEDIVKSFDK